MNLDQCNMKFGIWLTTPVLSYFLHHSCHYSVILLSLTWAILEVLDATSPLQFPCNSDGGGFYFKAIKVDLNLLFLCQMQCINWKAQGIYHVAFSLCLKCLKNQGKT